MRKQFLSRAAQSKRGSEDKTASSSRQGCQVAELPLLGNLGDLLQK